MSFAGDGASSVKVKAPNGTVIATIPTNTWTTVTISQVQKAGSPWSITVQADGGSAVQASFNNVSSTSVNSTDWVFTSNANLVGGVTTSSSSFRYLTTKFE
ncbi:MAG: hypothetical protein QM749_06555 [Aquabacterium sp.]